MVTHPLCTTRFAMITVTYLPLFVTLLFRGMPGIWKNRHRLLLCWLVCMQALYPGQKTLAELARWTPAQVTVWRFRRCSRRAIGMSISWWRGGFRKPSTPCRRRATGTCILWATGVTSRSGARRPPSPRKGRKSEHHPWFFGMRFALLLANWDVYRMPVAFRLIRPNSHPEYQPENALFREMVGDFVPPAWAKTDYRRGRCRLWLPRQYEAGPATRCQ